MIKTIHLSAMPPGRFSFSDSGSGNMAARAYSKNASILSVQRSRRDFSAM
jgi:hypothetical protein